MDNLVATHGYPGILHLNTCERAMQLLNIGLSALEIALNVGEDEYLTTEVLSGEIPTKDVRATNNKYDWSY